MFYLLEWIENFHAVGNSKAWKIPLSRTIQGSHFRCCIYFYINPFGGRNGERESNAALGRIKFLVPDIFPGSRKSRPDRPYENPGGSGRAGQTSGAQCTGKLQYATCAGG